MPGRRVALTLLPTLVAVACSGSSDDAAGPNGGAGGDPGTGGEAGSGGESAGSGGNVAACGELPPGVSVGPPDSFADNGLHKPGGSAPVLVGRDDDGLFARSALCTHQACNMNSSWGKLNADGGVTCTCHVSVFDALGRRVSGKAPKDLPALAIAVGCDGNLYVDTKTVVDPAARLVV